MGHEKSLRFEHINEGMSLLEKEPTIEYLYFPFTLKLQISCPGSPIARAVV
ncbi:predicted protein [Botrytis cinerea T4]|uniref:Uncharacterized protein n=1 Tax=Botryotinia fuckeliana (strain T4) TaxID=999810 RepID=G2YUW1_BOTF4|nr:predicted protein [Botrytis cinerea T4]